MRTVTFLTFLIITSHCLAQENDTISFPKEIQKQIDYRDSIYSPLNEISKCSIYCNNDSLKMAVSDGYIAKGVDFDKSYKIDLKNPLPYNPNKGNKNVLFLHFQPNPSGNEEMGDCPSSNLVVFLDIGKLEKRSDKSISENIQFALFTGGPFYRFDVEGKINGKIEIVKIKDGIAHIILFLNFDLVDENMTSIKLETQIRIINQSDINKNFG